MAALKRMDNSGYHPLDILAQVTKQSDIPAVARKLAFYTWAFFTDELSERQRILIVQNAVAEADEMDIDENEETLIGLVRRHQGWSVTKKFTLPEVKALIEELQRQRVQLTDLERAFIDQERVANGTETERAFINTEAYDGPEIDLDNLPDDPVAPMPVDEDEDESDYNSDDEDDPLVASVVNNDEVKPVDEDADEDDQGIDDDDDEERYAMMVQDKQEPKFPKTLVETLSSDEEPDEDEKSESSEVDEDDGYEEEELGQVTAVAYDKLARDLQVYADLLDRIEQYEAALQILKHPDKAQQHEELKKALAVAVESYNQDQLVNPDYADLFKANGVDSVESMQNRHRAFQLIDDKHNAKYFETELEKVEKQIDETKWAIKASKMTRTVHQIPMGSISKPSTANFKFDGSDVITSVPTPEEFMYFHRSNADNETMVSDYTYWWRQYCEVGLILRLLSEFYSPSIPHGYQFPVFGFAWGDFHLRLFMPPELDETQRAKIMLPPGVKSSQEMSGLLGEVFDQVKGFDMITKLSTMYNLKMTFFQRWASILILASSPVTHATVSERLKLRTVDRVGTNLERADECLQRFNDLVQDLDTNKINEALAKAAQSRIQFVDSPTAPLVYRRYPFEDIADLLAEFVLGSEAPVTLLKYRQAISRVEEPDSVEDEDDNNEELQEELFDVNPLTAEAQRLLRGKVLNYLTESKVAFDYRSLNRHDLFMLLVTLLPNKYPNPPPGDRTLTLCGRAFNPGAINLKTYEQLVLDDFILESRRRQKEQLIKPAPPVLMITNTEVKDDPMGVPVQPIPPPIPKPNAGNSVKYYAVTCLFPSCLNASGTFVINHVRIDDSKLPKTVPRHYEPNNWVPLQIPDIQNFFNLMETTITRRSHRPVDLKLKVVELAEQSPPAAGEPRLKISLGIEPDLEPDMGEFLLQAQLKSYTCTDREFAQRISFLLAPSDIKDDAFKGDFAMTHQSRIFKEPPRGVISVNAYLFSFPNTFIQGKDLVALREARLTWAGLMKECLLRAVMYVFDAIKPLPDNDMYCYDRSRGSHIRNDRPPFFSGEVCVQRCACCDRLFWYWKGLADMLEIDRTLIQYCQGKGFCEMMGPVNEKAQLVQELVKQAPHIYQRDYLDNATLVAFPELTDGTNEYGAFIKERSDAVAILEKNAVGTTFGDRTDIPPSHTMLTCVDILSAMASRHTLNCVLKCHYPATVANGVVDELSLPLVAYPGTYCIISSDPGIQRVVLPLSQQLADLFRPNTGSQRKVLLLDAIRAPLASANISTNYGDFDSATVKLLAKSTDELQTHVMKQRREVFMTMVNDFVVQFKEAVNEEKKLGLKSTDTQRIFINEALTSVTNSILAKYRRNFIGHEGLLTPIEDIKDQGVKPDGIVRAEVAVFQIDQNYDLSGNAVDIVPVKTTTTIKIQSHPYSYAVACSQAFATTGAELMYIQQHVAESNPEASKKAMKLLQSTAMRSLLALSQVQEIAPSNSDLSRALTSLFSGPNAAIEFKVKTTDVQKTGVKITIARRTNPAKVTGSEPGSNAGTVVARPARESGAKVIRKPLTKAQRQELIASSLAKVSNPQVDTGRWLTRFADFEPVLSQVAMDIYNPEVRIEQLDKAITEASKAANRYSNPLARAQEALRVMQPALLFRDQISALLGSDGGIDTTVVMGVAEAGSAALKRQALEATSIETKSAAPDTRMFSVDQEEEEAKEAEKKYLTIEQLIAPTGLRQLLRQLTSQEREKLSVAYEKEGPRIEAPTKEQAMLVKRGKEGEQQFREEEAQQTALIWQRLSATESAVKLLLEAFFKHIRGTQASGKRIKEFEKELLALVEKWKKENATLKKKRYDKYSVKERLKAKNKDGTRKFMYFFHPKYQIQGVAALLHKSEVEDATQATKKTIEDEDKAIENTAALLERGQGDVEDEETTEEREDYRRYLSERRNLQMKAFREFRIRHPDFTDEDFDLYRLHIYPLQFNDPVDRRITSANPFFVNPLLVTGVINKVMDVAQTTRRLERFPDILAHLRPARASAIWVAPRSEYFSSRVMFIKYARSASDDGQSVGRTYRHWYFQRTGAYPDIEGYTSAPLLDPFRDAMFADWGQTLVYKLKFIPPEDPEEPENDATVISNRAARRMVFGWYDPVSDPIEIVTSNNAAYEKELQADIAAKREKIKREEVMMPLRHLIDFLAKHPDKWPSELSKLGCWPIFMKGDDFSMIPSTEPHFCTDPDATENARRAILMCAMILVGRSSDAMHNKIQWIFQFEMGRPDVNAMRAFLRGGLSDDLATDFAAYLKKHKVKKGFKYSADEKKLTFTLDRITPPIPFEYDVLKGLPTASRYALVHANTLNWRQVQQGVITYADVWPKVITSEMYAVPRTSRNKIRALKRDLKNLEVDFNTVVTAARANDARKVTKDVTEVEESNPTFERTVTLMLRDYQKSGTAFKTSAQTPFTLNLLRYSFCHKAEGELKSVDADPKLKQLLTDSWSTSPAQVPVFYRFYQNKPNSSIQAPEQKLVNLACQVFKDFNGFELLPLCTQATSSWNVGAVELEERALIQLLRRAPSTSSFLDGSNHVSMLHPSQEGSNFDLYRNAASYEAYEASRPVKPAAPPRVRIPKKKEEKKKPKKEKEETKIRVPSPPPAKRQKDAKAKPVPAARKNTIIIQDDDNDEEIIDADLVTEEKKEEEAKKEEEEKKPSKKRNAKTRNRFTLAAMFARMQLMPPDTRTHKP